MILSILIASYPCALNSYTCQNFFFCDTTLVTPKCSCMSGARTAACTISVPSLYLSNPVSSTLSTTNWAFYQYSISSTLYLYHRLYLEGYNSDIQLSISKSAGSADVFLLYGSPLYGYLPIFLFYDSMYYMDSAHNQQNITLPKSDLQSNAYAGNYLYIAVFNEDASTISISTNLLKTGKFYIHNFLIRNSST